MYTKYDEYELLELFESNPIYVGEKEAEIFIYSKENVLKFEFVLTVSIYEEEASISLSYLNNMIYEFDLVGVEKIEIDKKKISFIKKNNINFSVDFSRNFYLSITNI